MLIQPSHLDGKRAFSQGYKDTVFLVWWKSNKPSIEQLRTIIPVDPETETKPSYETLRLWKNDYFIPKAAEMDVEFYDQITAISIQEKVEMLQRHSKVSVKMQEIAEQWINDHQTELTMNSAIRLLIEGVRIERESVGIPGALEKLSALTDDELLDEVKKILSESSGDFIPNAEED